MGRDDARVRGLLASNLGAYLVLRGISQADLARRAGLLRSTINTYFGAKSLPSPSRLQALADALEVVPADLLRCTAPHDDPERDLPADPVRNDESPKFSIVSVPGRPGFSKLELTADVPTATALIIMHLVTSGG